MLVFLVNMKKRFFNVKFNLTDYVLWLSSMGVIILAFFIFDSKGYLDLAASLIGVTSLIFSAKANPIGPILMIIFSILYGVISYTFRYYGEMITYLGMTLPMSVFALSEWLKNPFDGNRAQVKVGGVKKRDVIILVLATVAVTGGFYFCLWKLKTANLLISTVSVATSFIAAYFTLKRSPFFALGYAINDGVLIVMWVLASLVDRGYLSVVICFVVFLVNDAYGFISWCAIKKHQDLVLTEKDKTGD